MSTSIAPRCGFALVIACVFAGIHVARGVDAPQPPTIPVGLDSYRRWDQWPLQRIGCRAYMQSTYDRAGGNEGADASHFLYQLADDQNVTLDLEGPGVLYFARYNHWHGSPWHYFVDGADHMIQESSTRDPLHPVENSTFDPPAAFPRPLAFTWSDTKGADLSWVPIGFEKSFRMAYSRTRYGTGYYIFHRYVPGAALSHPTRSWDSKSSPDRDVLELLDRSGTDIAPARTGEPPLSFQVTTSNTMGEFLGLTQAPAVIRAFQVSAPLDQVDKLARFRVQATWDEREAPSIDAPLPLFFGAGSLYNRDGREYLVKSFPVSIRFDFDAKRIYLACYFPMPFFKKARIGLKSSEDIAIRDLEMTAQWERYSGPPNHVGYFHATYRDHPTPEKGKDLVLLDTRGVENSHDWTGSFVGTSFIFSRNANLTTLEGDPRFFFDDSESPQAQGTGTEEWGGGGDYWGGRNMTLPLAGHPVGARSAKEAECDDDKIESAYRFLLADLFPFGRNARIQLEHGGTNESSEHYETVTYWYGLPGASIVKTDELNIGDAGSEKAHAYDSPDATAPQRITSRFDQGGDEQTLAGRTTTGTSEFTVKVDPDNWGVMLRRTLDYQFPNQRAEVAVEANDGWKPAGVWYTAGSTTSVYSNPKEELGATRHIVQMSNRRFRDDEFLIGRDLTRGRESIRVRVRFTAVECPLFPGRPFPVKPAWSEVRYAAYCFVMPKAP